MVVQLKLTRVGMYVQDSKLTLEILEGVLKRLFNMKSLNLEKKIAQKHKQSHCATRFIIKEARLSFIFFLITDWNVNPFREIIHESINDTNKGLLMEINPETLGVGFQYFFSFQKFTDSDSTQFSLDGFNVNGSGE